VSAEVEPTDEDCDWPSDSEDLSSDVTVRLIFISASSTVFFCQM